MSVVIVTGAFGVLGRAVVAELIACGHSVAAIDAAPAPLESLQVLFGGIDLANKMRAVLGSIDMTKEAAEAFANNIDTTTGKVALFGGVDLTLEPAVQASYAAVVEQFGGLDGLVNVAGGFVWEPMESGTLDSWDKMYRINLRTAAASCRAALPHLLKSRGAIVNVGAAAAAQPGTGMAPYAASKAGVRALTESLAEELRGKGVRVNSLLPTIIDTPANRADMPDADTSAWVRPEAAAKVIAFLLSEESGAITGASLPLSLAGSSTRTAFI